MAGFLAWGVAMVMYLDDDSRRPPTWLFLAVPALFGLSALIEVAR
jgi:hypothetical protein